MEATTIGYIHIYWGYIVMGFSFRDCNTRGSGGSRFGGILGKGPGGAADTNSGVGAGTG